MADKTVEETPKTTEIKKKSGWFQKIPRDVLMSPGGVILVMLAFLIEIGDLIPIPIFDQLWELPLEIVFMVLLVVIAKPPLKTLIIPFIIERIPILSDIIPSWLLKMFM
jgi:hypothetical protein